MSWEKQKIKIRLHLLLGAAKNYYGARAYLDPYTVTLRPPDCSTATLGNQSFRAKFFHNMQSRTSRPTTLWQVWIKKLFLYLAAVEGVATTEHIGLPRKLVRRSSVTIVLLFATKLPAASVSHSKHNIPVSRITQ